MDVKQAYAIIKTKYPDMKVIDCLELVDSFAFALADKSWNGELLAGAYTTVNKANGKIGAIHPYDDALDEATEIPIDTLN